MPQSPIHSVHDALGARFVDFGGWSMPVQYSSVLDEHAAVRTAVGVFDVSHLGRFEVSGSGAVELVRGQLCNDITRIAPGRAQYTMALNERGGVEDDIIVWYRDADRLWVMPNGTNSDEIVARFRLAAPASVTVSDVRTDSVLFAVQGPTASAVFDAVLGVVPGRFRVIDAEFEGTAIVAAGTGYTGESGGEICAPAAVGATLWDALIDAGASPCGLGARDTLRLEMGYPLWGQDLDAETTPLQAGLGWVVSWDHDFVGKHALEASRNEPDKALIAFTTEGRAIPRHGYPFRSETGSGFVTSGNFSPTLGHGIGMASVSPPPGVDEQLVVEIRGKDVVATRTAAPFVTH